MEATPSVPSSCAQKTKENSLEHSRATDNTTYLIAGADVTLHDAGKKCRGIQAHLSMELGWDNTFAQRRRLAPTVMMFPSGSSQVSPWRPEQSLRGVSERAPSLCEITVSQTKDGVMQSVVVVGHCVRHAVARYHHSASRQGSLDRHVHGGYVEHLKHDLCLALSVGLGAQDLYPALGWRQRSHW